MFAPAVAARLAAQVAPRPFRTIDQVDHNVFIGGFLAASDPGEVRRRGITRIVKMFSDDAGYPGGYHRHPGVTYAVFPALDTPEYDIRGDAVEALRFIKEGVDANERVLVHCHAGISRSSTVVLLYLMIYQGLGLDEALDHLTRIRPVVAPNKGFMRHLRATDVSLHRLRKGS